MNKIVFLIIVSLSQTCFGFKCPPSVWSQNTETCKQRPGAKYKHNQCYFPNDPSFRYICHSRNNIDENLIANTKIYEDKPSNRVNYFKYFPKQNKTHIICGNDGLEKSCGDWMYYQFNKKNRIVHCKNGASDTIGKQISQKDVCQDIHFAEANNFAKMDEVKSSSK
jgi:hypothetical protein